MDFLPGFAQGVVRVLISYPFDYVRTHLQAGTTNTWRSIPLGAAAYRGVSIPLLTIPIDRALQFGIYERCQRRGYSQMASSFLATLLSSVYSVPANFLQTQVMLNSKRQAKDQVALTFANMSFRGYGADTARAFASSFLYLSTYGLLRNNVPQEHHNYFLFGVASSSIMWSVVYPLDTLRVLRQTATRHTSYISLLRQHSCRGLYRGLPLVLARSVPSSGFGMLTYEFMRECLNTTTKTNTNTNTTATA